MCLKQKAKGKLMYSDTKDRTCLLNSNEKHKNNNSNTFLNIMDETQKANCTVSTVDVHVSSENIMCLG